MRAGFWRANPFHGISAKHTAKLVPLPDCLHQMLHEVVLPNAKRDDSALFKERLAGDKAMLAALLALRLDPGKKSMLRAARAGVARESHHHLVG